MSKSVKYFKHFIWTDLEAPTQEELQLLTEMFHIDINLFEDILEQGHLPKIEKVNSYTFIILRAYSASLNANIASVGELSNKIAFFINETSLLTVHRASFPFLKNRLNDCDSSEALMLDIFNEILLTYEEPLQAQSDRMDEFEREIFLQSGHSISIESLYYQKSKARISKKILQLTQGVIVKPELNSTLQDTKETTLSYVLQYDEVIEDANTILNSYLSVTAQRSNDAMKLLTIFSAFFLPLTFIAGIYGMNFHNMPELAWQNGYFMTLGLMLIISIVIYLWFKRKKII